MALVKDMSGRLLLGLTIASFLGTTNCQSEASAQQQLSSSQKDLLYGKPRNFVRAVNASKTSFTAEEKQLLLQLHNAYRSMVQPPARSMRELVWDTDLEEFARRHTQACTGAHSGRSMVKVWSKLVSERWQLMGENLYWSYGDRYSIEEALWMFWEEGSGYNIYTNTCTHRLTCGHYKALVLESSWRVGCSINQCQKFSNNPYPGPAIFIACSYNGMYVHTARPYTVGDPCSGCDARTVGFQHANCRHRLCVTSQQLRMNAGFDGNTTLTGLNLSDFSSNGDSSAPTTTTTTKAVTQTEMSARTTAAASTTTTTREPQETSTAMTISDRAATSTTTVTDSMTTDTTATTTGDTAATSSAPTSNTGLRHPESTARTISSHTTATVSDPVTSAEPTSGTNATTATTTTATFIITTTTTTTAETTINDDLGTLSATTTTSSPTLATTTQSATPPTTPSPTSAATSTTTTAHPSTPRTTQYAVSVRTLTPSVHTADPDWTGLPDTTGDGELNAARTSHIADVTVIATVMILSYTSVQSLLYTSL